MKLIMIFVFMLLAIDIGAATINVPDDYATIQGAIDIAVDGDSVIVAPGIYVENIIFYGKGITVGSWYCTTQDTSYISQTVIDGGHNRSVIRFICGEDSTSSVIGFTIMNGNDLFGGGILCRWSSNPTLMHLVIKDNVAHFGGGIYCESSDIILEDLILRDNIAEEGGGLYCRYSELNLENVTISGNSAYNFGGGIMCKESCSLNFSAENRCNIFENNVSNRNQGNEIYSESPQYVVVDTFTVAEPTDFHTYPIENFTFNILNGLYNQVSGDLYVSPEGDNINSGISSEMPLRTIRYACCVICANSENPCTINLLEGTYSPSINGEYFPISLPEYVSLTGVSEESVILDAESYTNVMRFHNYDNVAVSNLTITNGYSQMGGGIHCNNSYLSMMNVRVVNNSSYESGGGIYLFNSNSVLENVEITNNLTENSENGSGGGIYFEASSITIENSIVLNNFASADGGGIFCNDSNLSLFNVIIESNASAGNGGGISCINESETVLENITIRNNNSNCCGGGINCYMSDMNIERVNLINNSANNGGGMYIYYSDPFLRNTLFSENHSINYGGGIFCNNNSNPVMVGVTFSDNTADTFGGGIFCISNCEFYFVNGIMWNNSPQQVYFYGSGSLNIINIAYSDIGEGISSIIINNNGAVHWLAGNIDANPLFIDPANGNYLLEQTSPCIDAGTAYFEYEAEVLIDLDEDEYWGEAPDMGAFEYGMVEIDEDEVIIENGKWKIENYPNPFNPETRLVFNLPEAEQERLAVYNLKGQLVKVLADEILPAGDNRIVWDGRNENGRMVSSGVYLVRMQCENASVMKKIMLIK